MRITCACLIILLHCLAADARDRVTVEEPITSLAASDQQLREACGAQGNYDACTRFVAFRIDASCSTSAEGWQVTGATATFRPYILLRELHSLAHEYQHVDDLRHSIDRLLIEMEEARFDSEAGCLALVAREKGAFGATMQRFALESNLSRHPSLRKRDARDAR